MRLKVFPRTAGRLLCGLLFLLALPAFGQQEAALTIRFANGGSRFHVGEVIPVELTFSASVDKTYQMSTRSYDRSGRLGLEEFEVSPTGRDPLHDYYQSGVIPGFMGGGLGSSRYLTSEPLIMEEDLNEWVVIERPGRYTLQVASSRVSRRGESGVQPLELRSNPLEFEVVAADPGWQEQELGAAVSMLRSETSSAEEKRAALRRLRFLDSPRSVAELVRQVGAPGDGGRWEAVLGLWGSRHRELVIEELERQLAAPQTAITVEYVNLLAQLKALAARGPMPPYPAQDQEAQKAWQAREQELQKQRQGALEELYAQVPQLVFGKQGAARAETVRTLLYRPAGPGGSGSASVGVPESEVESAFLAFTAQEQADLLEFSWERLKTPGMADALEKLLDRAQLPHYRLRSLALERLYQLDAGRGRARILAEIRAPHVDAERYTVSAKALGALPERTLPQFDELLAARLEARDSRTRELDAQLIGRYATRAILPRVRAVYAPSAGQWVCTIEDGLVSYFLRVDLDYGMQRVKQGATQCMGESMQAVVRMKRWEQVEPALVARLNDPKLWVARAAAETLALYGGPKAEQAMWERLRRFHQQWAPRAQDLQDSPEMKPGANDAMGFQFGLVEALGRAQGWVLDDDQVSELEKLTLGPERQSVAQWHWRSPMPLEVNYVFERLQASINGQYFPRDAASLRAKLEQYPGGTQFLLHASGSQEQLAPALEAIREAAQRQGLVIEEESGP